MSTEGYSLAELSQAEDAAHADCDVCDGFDGAHELNCPHHPDYDADPQPEWVPVAGYEGLYEVSDFGEVKSLGRALRPGRGNFSRPSVILSQALRSGRYPCVLLYKDGARKQVSVHRIVLEAFVGAAPVGMQASHLDGNSTNNRADNLEWATPQQNNAEKIRHGTQAYGEAHHASKLTVKDVRTILQMDLNRCTLAQIADEVGISISQVRNVLTGKSWGSARENIDWAPYCSYGHRSKSDCDCGPIAENN